MLFRYWTNKPNSTARRRARRIERPSPAAMDELRRRLCSKFTPLEPCLSRPVEQQPRGPGRTPDGSVREPRPAFAGFSGFRAKDRTACPADCAAPNCKPSRWLSPLGPRCSICHLRTQQTPRSWKQNKYQGPYQPLDVNRRWKGTPDWNAPLTVDSLQVGN